MSYRNLFACMPLQQAALLFAVSSGLILAPLAQAAEYDMSGRLKSVNSHMLQSLSAEHTVLFASMEESAVTEDYLDTPWAGGVAGICGGVVEIKGKDMKGNGLCTFADADEDQFVVAWEAQAMNEKGGPQGVWKITGGTGKYANAEAGGSYTDLPDAEGSDTSTVHLTGSMTIP
ncbi:MAG: hypothetical protein R3E95_16095 [Thiolinea sp.]